MPSSRRHFLQALAGAALTPLAPPPRPGIKALLEPIRRKYDLPALAAAVLSGGQTIALSAVGVRKYGASIAVTPGDQFHLGSDTKAMTATLCGMLIERGHLAWNTTLPQAFPGVPMHPANNTVTLDHLLAHRSGFSDNSWPQGQTFDQMYTLPGTPRQQRMAYLRAILPEAPVSTPGTQFLYSNRNYIVAGAMLEQVTNTAWEAFIHRELFTPLGMHTAGFGAMGTPGHIDQPWQHVIANGKTQPIEPGPRSDNPPVLAPAGRVHCSLGDWAKFVQLHIQGTTRTSRLLRPETLQRLHAPQFGGDYAGGWLLTDRPWGGGRVLTHAGSNTMNYAVAWLAPLKNFAVLVTTNEGGDAAAQATDDAAAALIQRFLQA